MARKSGICVRHPQLEYDRGVTVQLIDAAGTSRDWRWSIERRVGFGINSDLERPTKRRESMDEEFMQGYIDGYDLDCPEPTGNRHSAYKHSFAIGRAERLGNPTPAAHISRARAELIRAGN